MVYDAQNRRRTVTDRSLVPTKIYNYRNASFKRSITTNPKIWTLTSVGDWSSWNNFSATAETRTHGATAVVYIHAGQQTVCDDTRGANANTTPAFRYVWGDYIDEPILRQTGSSTLLYYHHNQQYSTVALTSASGLVVPRFGYTAYGDQTIMSHTGASQTYATYSNRHTYTGREWDDSLKAHYFRARWYDAALGRFVNRDPIGYVVSIAKRNVWTTLFCTNVYELTIGSPVQFVDPQGTQSLFLPTSLPGIAPLPGGLQPVVLPPTAPPGLVPPVFRPPYTPALPPISPPTSPVPTPLVKGAACRLVLTRTCTVAAVGYTSFECGWWISTTTGLDVWCSEVYVWSCEDLSIPPRISPRQPPKGPGPGWCNPYIPPIGTIIQEIVPSGNRKRGRHSDPGHNQGHVKHWVLGQTPFPDCKCMWNKNNPFTLENTQTPLPNSISGNPNIQPAGGGLRT